MDPDGSAVRRLTTEEVDTDAAWSRTVPGSPSSGGFWHEDAGIYVVDADGSEPQRITDPGSLVDGSDIGPAWSPDGTRIAFAREGREEGAETGNADIYTVSPDATDLVRLTDGPVMEYEPAGRPTGRGSRSSAASWPPEGSRPRRSACM
jgi:Tol biopolymer transport system component